jgi:hypothetical protein
MPIRVEQQAKNNDLQGGRSVSGGDDIDIDMDIHKGSPLLWTKKNHYILQQERRWRA